MKRVIAAVAFTGLIVLSSSTSVFAQAGGGKGGPASAAMAPSPLVASCTVKSVDVNGMKFTCNNQSYGVSTSTTFNLGSAGSSLAGLKVGMAVTVTYEISGSANVAESVTSP